MAKSTKKVDALRMFESSVPEKSAPRQKPAEKKPAPIPGEETNEIQEPLEMSVSEKKSTSGIQLMKAHKEKEVRKNKSRTFYMSDTLYDKLRSLAKENECSASEYLSFLLEQII